MALGAHESQVACHAQLQRMTLVAAGPAAELRRTSADAVFERAPIPCARAGSTCLRRVRCPPRAGFVPGLLAPFATRLSRRPAHRAAQRVAHSPPAAPPPSRERERTPAGSFAGWAGPATTSVRGCNGCGIVEP